MPMLMFYEFQGIKIFPDPHSFDTTMNIMDARRAIARQACLFFQVKQIDLIDQLNQAGVKYRSSGSPSGRNAGLMVFR